MLQLLSAQLRRHEHSAQGVAVERSFAQYAAFAFVWAFGGELRPAARERFEAAVMSYVKQLSPDFPTTDGTTMFDHYPDGRGGYHSRIEGEKWRVERSARHALHKRGARKVGRHRLGKG